MKMPTQIVRMLALLPPEFKGTVILHTNGKGLWSYEVHHKETVQGDALRDVVDMSGLLPQPSEGRACRS